jgi:uncharacterized protein with FMN-binding domain
MRRIVFAILSTITTVVLLFSYHTSTNAAGAGAGASPVAQVPATPAAPVSPGSGSQSRSSTKSGSTTGTSSPANYTGAAANTQWGTVQVRITVQSGKITSSQAVQYPQGTSRDTQINSTALPILNQEAVQQQSASIDTVSGATVTSGGYLQSLQSAIDQAHL